MIKIITTFRAIKVICIFRDKQDCIDGNNVRSDGCNKKCCEKNCPIIKNSEKLDNHTEKMIGIGRTTGIKNYLKELKNVKGNQRNSFKS